jgi:hypothetical protein
MWKRVLQSSLTNEYKPGIFLWTISISSSSPGYLGGCGLWSLCRNVRMYGGED